MEKLHCCLHHFTILSDVNDSSLCFSRQCWKCAIEKAELPEPWVDRPLPLPEEPIGMMHQRVRAEFMQKWEKSRVEDRMHDENAWRDRLQSMENAWNKKRRVEVEMNWFE